jgi:hypothetical protein
MSRFIADRRPRRDGQPGRGKPGIDKPLIELVKLRASQLNGCASLRAAAGGKRSRRLRGSTSENRPISDIQPLIGPISQAAAAVARLLVLWKLA